MERSGEYNFLPPKQSRVDSITSSAPGVGEVQEMCKVVCGLPCTSKRRERELMRTLDILTGGKPKRK